MDITSLLSFNALFIDLCSWSSLPLHFVKCSAYKRQFNAKLADQLPALINNNVTGQDTGIRREIFFRKNLYWLTINNNKERSHLQFEKMAVDFFRDVKI